MRPLLAAAVYFLVVFGAGFVLGSIRVLWLEPRLGTLLATACEAPFLLMTIVFAARWVPRTMKLKHDRTSLLAMGICALAFQQMADLAVGLGLRGVSFGQQIAHLATPQGTLYVFLLIIFAGAPVVLNRR